MVVKYSEAVISGMGGKFPECSTVEDFKEKLFAGSNLLCVDEERYISGCKYYNVVTCKWIYYLW